MLTFIAAVYNEEQEIADLLDHVAPYVDAIRVVDDGSVDHTCDILNLFAGYTKLPYIYKSIPHTGLPETVKNDALQMVDSKSWVLMLDADERFAPGVLESIQTFLNSPQEAEVSHVYFEQLEIIDGSHVRTFSKAKLFRKEAISFPLNNIHADDQFTGDGAFYGWQVYHRKGSYKQIQRETEYLATYKRLLVEGKIDEGRYNWLVGLHHYVKPH